MNTNMQFEFSEMARREHEDVLSHMPKEPLPKFLLFTEITRVLDYLNVFQPLIPKQQRLSIQDFDFIRSGWNLAAENLFTAVSAPGAFPISESTNESRSFATSVLHQLGRSLLLKRVSEMIQHEVISVEENGDKYIVRKSKMVSDQFLDYLESDRLGELSAELNDNNVDIWNGWKIIDIDDYSKYATAPGYYLGKHSRVRSENYKVRNLAELMTPLVHPWDSGHGIMMGYGTVPEVDIHYLAEAAEQVAEWTIEAGLHPNARLGGINGADIAIIITFLTALHLKHRGFALLALRNYPEISIPQSLTIWGPLDALEDSIVDYSNLDRILVRKSLDAITMRPDEAPHLHGVTTPFIPLLISLGNGLVLRPLSSLARNPFLSTITLQEWRNSEAKDRLNEPREEWMRSEIYSLFQGTRYKRVNGNIKIRNGNKIVTDIDGAVYDTLTGELALFQIKWQDYFTNDVRQLRSKAGNLAKELDEWATKVENWIEQSGKSELIQALRLRLGKGMLISSIYLFGISRTIARTSGYGFTLKNKSLVVANWPQFVRVRFEVGPAKRVFRRLFKTLKKNETITTHPVPVTMNVAGKIICFEDLWNRFGEEDKGELCE